MCFSYSLKKGSAGRSWSSMGSSSTSIGSKQTMNALLNSMDSLHLFQSSTNNNVIGIRGNLHDKLRRSFTNLPRTLIHYVFMVVCPYHAK